MAFLTLPLEIIVVGLTLWTGNCVLVTPNDGIDEVLVAVVGTFRIFVIFESESAGLRMGDLFGDDVLGACVDGFGIDSLEIVEFVCNFWSLVDNSLLFKLATVWIKKLVTIQVAILKYSFFFTF